MSDYGELLSLHELPTSVVVYKTCFIWIYLSSYFGECAMIPLIKLYRVS